MAKPPTQYAFTDAVDTTQWFNHDELLNWIEEQLEEHLERSHQLFVWDRKGKKYTINVLVSVVHIVPGSDRS